MSVLDDRAMAICLVYEASMSGCSFDAESDFGSGGTRPVESGLRFSGEVSVNEGVDPCDQIAEFDESGVREIESEIWIVDGA